MMRLTIARRPCLRVRTLFEVDSTKHIRLYSCPHDFVTSRIFIHRYVSACRSPGNRTGHNVASSPRQLVRLASLPCPTLSVTACILLYLFRVAPPSFCPVAEVRFMVSPGPLCESRPRLFIFLFYLSIFPGVGSSERSLSEVGWWRHHCRLFPLIGWQLRRVALAGPSARFAWVLTMDGRWCWGGG